jgi:hypothetical protein
MAKAPAESSRSRRRTKALTPLEAVTEAAHARRESSEAFVASLKRARDAGFTWASIGEAAGLSHQAVRYFVMGDPRRKEQA